MGVVGDEQQRSVSGDLSEQVEHCQSDEEDRGRGAFEHPERGQQRVPLGTRQAVDTSQDRAQQLM